MSRHTHRQSRRKFLTAVPAAVAGAVTARTYAQGQPTPGPVKPATIEAAESIMGLDFHTDEETALANGVNNRLRVFQQLRQSDVPFDTEVAVVFKPALPGKEPKGPATPGASDSVRQAAPDIEAPGQSRGSRLLADPEAGRADRAPPRDVDGTDSDVPRAAQTVSAHAEFLRDADRRRSRSNRRPRRTRRSRPASTAARCTGCRGARRTCSRPRASRRRSAASRTWIR